MVDLKIRKLLMNVANLLYSNNLHHNSFELPQTLKKANWLLHFQLVLSRFRKKILPRILEAQDYKLFCFTLYSGHLFLKVKLPELRCLWMHTHTFDSFEMGFQQVNISPGLFTF